MAMDTFFASAERVTRQQLESEIRLVSESPIVSGILRTVNGILAVLDDHRQLIAMNSNFMDLLGIDDPESVLGLRPGQILQCVYCDGEPAGCGTTRFCSTCGAAVAIVASLGQDRPVERLCALRTRLGGVERDMALKVRSQPIAVGESRFLLIFIEDVTRQQKYAALERTFYHDINNVIGMMVGNGELLVMENDSSRARAILSSTRRLAREISIQKMLASTKSESYNALLETYTTDAIMDELRSFFISHPATGGRTLVYSNHARGHRVVTDFNLLQRVLANMVINALEATEDGGLVKVTSELNRNLLAFSVWNGEAIPEDVQRRIFQRNFSTKNEPGRGIGTYSMKLLGEDMLGGKVSFTSTPEKGTTFSITLPGSREEAARMRSVSN
jgi:signal transduction histidine kinase